jgi:hypothetical protein
LTWSKGCPDAERLDSNKNIRATIADTKEELK